MRTEEIRFEHKNRIETDNRILSLFELDQNISVYLVAWNLKCEGGTHKDGTVMQWKLYHIMHFRVGRTWTNPPEKCHCSQ